MGESRNPSREQYLSNLISGRKKSYDGPIEFDEITNILMTVNPEKVRVQITNANGPSLDRIVKGQEAAVMINKEFAPQAGMLYLSLNWKFYGEVRKQNSNHNLCMKFFPESPIRGKHYFTIIQKDTFQGAGGKYVGPKPVKKAVLSYIA